MTRGQLVDSWMYLFHDGPTAMIDSAVERLTPELNPAARELLKSLARHLRQQTEWIVRSREEIDSEVAKVREIGKTMQLAGLRSYTDKEGRIYVASPLAGTDRKVESE